MESNQHAEGESETLFSDGFSQSTGSQGSSSSPDSPATTPSPWQTPSAKQKAYYNMKHKRRGRVIIFIHENFEQYLKVKRVSSTNSTNELEEYFKKFGFDPCEIKIDLSEREIHQVLKRAAAEDHTDRDCIVVVVLTLGRGGYLYSKDSWYKPEDIWAPFAANKCPSLADKPKLFFIQSQDAFTNNPDDREIMTDGSHCNYLPVQSDFLIAYSTTPGFMCGFLKETLSNMLNFNNDFLTSLSIAEPVQQIPTITHTLRRLVKFRERNHLLESVIMNDSPESGGEQVLRTEELDSCESDLLLRLFQLRDENFTSIHQYIYSFTNLIQKMNDKGELLDDKLMLRALLYGLPKSMSNREEFRGYITKKYPLNAQYQIVLEELKVLSKKEFSDPNQSGYNLSTPLGTEKHLADDTEDNTDDLTVDDPILQHISENHKYKMETMEDGTIGLALLIAHETFIKEEKDKRPGFNLELFQIVKKFTGLGFHLRQCLNQSKEAIINFLNNVGKEDHSNINCLAVIVCSHGGSGGMIHADDGKYSVYDLFEPFRATNCSTLAGKPKLFFLGPCRGSEFEKAIKLDNDDVPCHSDSDMQTDMGGRTRSDLEYPKKKKKRVTIELPWPHIEDHFLVSFSTVQNHLAFSSPDYGSRFIKFLYKKLRAQRDIQHILTFVNYESALISTPKYAQISQVTSKLRKILVFPSNVKEGSITDYSAMET